MYAPAVSITQEILKAKFKYDPNTGLFHYKLNPKNGSKIGDVAGRFQIGGYRQIRICGRLKLASHLAWLYVYGVLPYPYIDHKNGCRGDDRIANLRLATKVENGQNITKYKNNTSGCVGVSFCSGSGRWRARIQIAGRVVFLGRYDTKEEAQVAYTTGKKILHKFQPVLR